MIEVRNITKIYGRGKKKVVALDGVSFTLPSSGMVFIVGKSGCGKSTLLNMIGGCDKLTSGDIVMDGNAFSSFRERDFDSFRNGYVGFVFQDYCLLEGLSVFENVSLALELQGEEGEEAVREALEKVGLSDCADRRPNELSGGQKQRVAIARTLVKKPKLILADEPTGNLDEKSSAVILDLLKEMSKEMLVLIVSHNRPDAEKYADRILELLDGKIVSDLSRDPAVEEVAFAEGKIVFQRGTVFSEEVLGKMNERLFEGGVRLVQADETFVPTPPVEGSEEKIPLTRHKLRFRTRKTLFKLFAKKRIVGMALSVLCAVFLFWVLGVCQFFTAFDPARETARIMREHNGSVLAMCKGYIAEGDPTKTVDTSRLLHASEEEVAAFREAGYEGNIFPLYNVAMIAHENSGALHALQTYLPPAIGENYSNFYCKSGLGVLQVTEDYLVRRYGKDGKLSVLSGELTAEGDGIIVTDYFADSVVAQDAKRRPIPSEFAVNGDKYAKITDGKIYNGRYRVCAVIDTGYKERYAELIERWEEGEKIADMGDLAIEFYEELNDGLNLGYTLNPNFLQAFNADKERTFAHFGEGVAEIDGKVGTLTTGYCYRTSALQDDEIEILESVYCKLTGEDSGENAAGKKIKLRLGDLYSKTYNIEREFTIAGTYHDGSTFHVSPAVFESVIAYSVYAYALYFDNVESATGVYQKATELGYSVQSPLFSAMYTVSGAAGAFVDFFEILIGVMYALVALTLAGFAAGSVRKCIYEIGVLRAIGAKLKDLTPLFVAQMILVSVAVCLLAGFWLWLGAGMCNAVLAEGFVAVTKNAAIREINFIRYAWTTVLIDAGIVFGLTVLCVAVPLLLLRRIKPREIIRAKE